MCVVFMDCYIWVLKRYFQIIMIRKLTSTYFSALCTVRFPLHTDNKSSHVIIYVCAVGFCISHSFISEVWILQAVPDATKCNQNLVNIARSWKVTAGHHLEWHLSLQVQTLTVTYCLVSCGSTKWWVKIITSISTRGPAGAGVDGTVLSSRHIIITK